MALSLKQIRYFVATAETGQISHAAVELMISQSAVTTAIKDLERTVGAELFERHPHGMELTSSGREFLSHAYGILDKVREATQLNLAENDLKANLTVAATYTVIGYFLPYHIERLQRLLPRLEIQLFELNRESIEEGLLALLVAGGLAAQTLRESIADFAPVSRALTPRVGVGLLVAGLSSAW